jgi:hypothetical protein
MMGDGRPWERTRSIPELGNHSGLRHYQDPERQFIEGHSVGHQHALLIVEERLREQEAEGVRVPEGMAPDELALRVLIVAETGQVPRLR